jgi:hypothetical protein
MLERTRPVSPAGPTSPAQGLIAWPRPTRKPTLSALPTRGLAHFSPPAQGWCLAPLTAQGLSS